MCRYAFYSYKPHYACFDCRKSFKRRLLNDVDESRAESAAATCPDCGALTANMGKDFKAPPRKELKAWQHLRLLYSVGIAFHSCGCNGPGYVPADAGQLANSLAARQAEYVKNLRFWLNKAELSKADYARDRQKNFEYYGRLPDKDSGETPGKAVEYWQGKLRELDEKLARARAALA